MTLDRDAPVSPSILAAGLVDRPRRDAGRRARARPPRGLGQPGHGAPLPLRSAGGRAGARRLAVAIVVAGRRRGRDPAAGRRRTGAGALRVACVVYARAPARRAGHARPARPARPRRRPPVRAGRCASRSASPAPRSAATAPGPRSPWARSSSGWRWWSRSASSARTPGSPRRPGSATSCPGDEILTAIAPAPAGDGGIRARARATSPACDRATPVASFDLALAGTAPRGHRDPRRRLRGRRPADVPRGRPRGGAGGARRRRGGRPAAIAGRGAGRRAWATHRCSRGRRRPGRADGRRHRRAVVPRPIGRDRARGLARRAPAVRRRRAPTPSPCATSPARSPTAGRRRRASSPASSP